MNSLPRLLAELQSTAALPLNRATTLPAGVYTDSGFLAWETEHVLRAEWLCLCHLSQIPAPGDFIKVDLLNEPLIAVHGHDGEFRAFSRICPHRSMDIMPPSFGSDENLPAILLEAPDRGHSRFLQCPYHFWSFDLDGSLKGCPEMQHAEGFDRADHSLTTYRTALWNGFLFVNLDGTATDLHEQYSGLHADTEGWQMADLGVVISRTWECDFNWKVLVENFMECYHHLGAHSETLQPFLPAKAGWTSPERLHSIRLNLPIKDGSPDPDPVTSFPLIDTLPAEHRQQWSALLGTPSFLLFAGPDRMIWYRIDPISADRSRLLTTVMVPKSTTELPDFETRRAAQERMLVDFHLEDMDVCIAVQRGLHSPAARPGRLSHLEEPIHQFQRYLARRAAGANSPVDPLNPIKAV